MRPAGVAAEIGPRFYVEVRGQELDGHRFQVSSDGLLIGRSSTCDVIFENREVSRRHCYFYSDDRFCYVQDLGSKNGIFVNGELAKGTRLTDGDVVDIGPSRMVLRAEGSSPRTADDLPPVVPAAQGEADEVTAEVPLRHPLALAGLVFALLAYLHWAFGLCAVILALVVLWEVRKQPEAAARALAVGALALGGLSGGLNAWFTEWTPRLQRSAERRALLECRDNLTGVAAALKAYRSAHDGAYPAQLDDLVRDGLIEPGRLACPGCRLSEAAVSCYVFFAPRAGTPERPLDVVVSDPIPACHEKRGGWVLRNDGPPEWMPSEPLARLLRQMGATRQPTPATQRQPGERGP